MGVTLRKKYEPEAVVAFRAARDVKTASWMEKLLAVGLHGDIAAEAAAKQADRDTKRPPAIGVDVQRAKEGWNPSPEVLAKAVREGWLTMSRGKITIHGGDGDVSYDVVRTPGHYCCHCGLELDNAGDALMHLAAKHAGSDVVVHVSPDGLKVVPHGFPGARKLSLVLSPDKNNPVGYQKINHYECKLSGEQEGS